MNFINFTENLNCYINALQENMQDLEIGLYIDAVYLQMYYEDSKVECKIVLIINYL